MHPPSRPHVPSGRGWLIPALIIAVALALVAFFDLTTNLPLSDEWMFRWPIGQLAAGRGLRLWPGVLPVALVQMLAAAPLAAAGLEPRWWRLTVIPFLLLAAACTAALSLRQGADRFWAAAGAAVLVTSPIFLSVATGLTSDIAYLGLLMAALLAGYRWVETGRGAPLAALLAVVATLERQHGLAIGAALTVGLWAARSKRDVRSAEWAWLAVTGAGSVAAIALPFMAGWASSTMADVSSGRSRLHPTVGSVVGTLVELGPVLGLLGLPFLLPLQRRSETEVRTNNRLALLPVVVGASGIAASLTFAIYFGVMIWPGNVWSSSGLGPTHIGGAKPPLIPITAFLAIEALTVVSIFVLFFWRRRALLHPGLGNGGAFLLAAAIFHLGPMPFTSPLDRYYLAVAAPLVPILAGLARRGSSDAPRLAAWARGWAIAFLVLGVGYFAFGEQDYLAWQAARDRAARFVYAQVDPAVVDAGYEETASYAAVPAFATTGRLVMDPVDLVPAQPRLRLLFAPRGDPRLGFDWSSVSPGRVVIVCARAGSTPDPHDLARSCP